MNVVLKLQLKAKMIIPAKQFNAAERLMKSQGRTGTADNDINAS